jgi:hypothetical protein
MFYWNRLVSLADRFSKHWLPAGDDPEQNRHDGKEKENVNQAAGGAGHHSQQPQNNQDDGKRV